MNNKPQLPIWIKIAWIGAILANIKSVFADYDVDLSYAVVTSYRHLSGERMFMEMREPHQTSGFLLDALMWIFRRITGSYDGVVVFLNIFGVIAYAVLAVLLVNTLKKYTDLKIAHLIGVMVFAFRVRQIVMPEFSNMLSGFSILLIVLLIRHLEKENDLLYLFASALTLCLMALSYPSAVIAYIAVIVVFIRYSKTKKKDILFFSIICATCGAAYILLFSIRAGGLAEFIGILKLIVSGDSTHDFGFNSDLGFYFRDLIIGCAWLIASYLVASFISLIYKAISKKTNPSIFAVSFGCVFILINLITCVSVDVIQKPTMKYVFGSIWLFLIIYAFFGIKECSEGEKGIWVIALFISLADIISVFALTNMDLISVIQYLVPAGAVSVIPLSKRFAKNQSYKESSFDYSYILPVFIALLVVLHRGIVMRDYAVRCSSIAGIESIVKNGPAKGIVCSYMSSYMTKCNEEDWIQYVNPGESVLVVSNGLYDPLVYIFCDSSVSHYSTIDTPTFDETLISYWEQYPEKKPSVIAVECWYGDMHVEEDSWIMNWISENCEMAADGRYFRFYRVK